MNQPAGGNNPFISNEVPEQLLSSIKRETQTLPSNVTPGRVRAIHGKKLLQLLERALDPARRRLQQQLNDTQRQYADRIAELEGELARAQGELDRFKSAQSSTTRFELPRLAGLIDDERLRAENAEADARELRDRIEELQGIAGIPTDTVALPAPELPPADHGGESKSTLRARKAELERLLNEEALTSADDTDLALRTRLGELETQLSDRAEAAAQSEVELRERIAEVAARLEDARILGPETGGAMGHRLDELEEQLAQLESAGAPAATHAPLRARRDELRALLEREVDPQQWAAFLTDRLGELEGELAQRAASASEEQVSLQARIGELEERLSADDVGPESLEQRVADLEDMLSEVGTARSGDSPRPTSATVVGLQSRIADLEDQLAQARGQVVRAEPELIASPIPPTDEALDARLESVHADAAASQVATIELALEHFSKAQERTARLDQLQDALFSLEGMLTQHGIQQAGVMVVGDLQAQLSESRAKIQARADQLINGLSHQLHSQGHVNRLLESQLEMRLLLTQAEQRRAEVQRQLDDAHAKLARQDSHLDERAAELGLLEEEVARLAASEAAARDQVTALEGHLESIQGVVAGAHSAQDTLEAADKALHDQQATLEFVAHVLEEALRQLDPAPLDEIDAPRAQLIVLPGGPSTGDAGDPDITPDSQDTAASGDEAPAELPQVFTSSQLIQERARAQARVAARKLEELADFDKALAEVMSTVQFLGRSLPALRRTVVRQLRDHKGSMAQVLERTREHRDELQEQLVTLQTELKAVQLDRDRTHFQLGTLLLERQRDATSLPAPVQRELDAAALANQHALGQLEAVESQLAALTQACDEAALRVTELVSERTEDELAALAPEREALDQAHEALAQDRAQLEEQRLLLERQGSELAAARAETATLTQRLEAAQAELRSQSTALGHQHATNVRERAELTAAQEQLSAGREALLGEAQQTKALAEQLENARAGLESELADLRAQREALAAERQALHADVRTQREALASERQALLGDVQSQRDVLAAEHQALSADRQALNAERQALATAQQAHAHAAEATENELLTQARAEATTQRDAAARAEVALRNLRDELNTQRAAGAELEAQLDAVNGTLAATTATADSLESELGAVRRTVDEHAATSDQLEAQLSATQAALAEEQAQLAQLRAARAEPSDTQAARSGQVEELQAKHEEQAKQLEQLRAELARAERSHEEKLAELRATLAQESSARKTELEELHVENDALREAARDQLREVEILDDKLGRTRVALAAREEELGELEADLRALEEQGDSGAEIDAELIHDLHQAHAEIQRLSDELAEAKKALESECWRGLATHRDLREALIRQRQLELALEQLHKLETLPTEIQGVLAEAQRQASEEEPALEERCRQLEAEVQLKTVQLERVKLEEALEARASAGLEPLADDEVESIRWLLDPSPTLVEFQKLELEATLRAIDDDLDTTRQQIAEARRAATSQRKELVLEALMAERALEHARGVGVTGDVLEHKSSKATQRLTRFDSNQAVSVRHLTERLQEQEDARSWLMREFASSTEETPQDDFDALAEAEDHKAAFEELMKRYEHESRRREQVERDALQAMTDMHDERTRLEEHITDLERRIKVGVASSPTEQAIQIFHLSHVNEEQGSLLHWLLQEIDPRARAARDDLTGDVRREVEETNGDVDADQREDLLGWLEPSNARWV